MNPRKCWSLAAVLALTASPSTIHAGAAGVSEHAAPISRSGTTDADCGNANAYYMIHSVVPSIAVTICRDCRFTESDRYAFLQSYAGAAQRAGYLIDPLNSSVFVITETGVLPNGKPFLAGIVGNKQVTVGDPLPGETLAGVAGKLALIIVADDQ